MTHWQATESVKQVLGQVKAKDVEGPVLDMVRRLMQGESYTSKFAATQLIPFVYPHVSQAAQQELMK